MIKAIFFDLDDSLFDSTKLAEKARRSAIKAILDLGLTLEYDEEKCYEILLEVIDEFGSNYSYHFDQLIKRIDGISKLYSSEIGEFLAIKGMIPPPKMIVQAVVIAYHNIKFTEIKPFDDVIPFFNDVKKFDKNLKICIITDGLPDKQYEKILRLKIHKYLNDIIISDEVGVRKPNPKLYLIALERFDIKPEESIYIGDHYEKDIVPAKKIGMHTVLIHRKGKYDRKFHGKEGPDFEIDSLDQLLEIIKKLNKN